MSSHKFIEISESFFVDADFAQAFRDLGLTSIDAVFSFDGGVNLTKNNLAKYRTRRSFQVDSPPTTMFLKRYDCPPVLTQLGNWLSRHRRTSSICPDLQATKQLRAVGVNTPKVISFGRQWGSLFEKRSFIVTEKIPDAESLERKLPDYFNGPATSENLKLRRDFIRQLSTFIKKFHQTNFRHRDLYFSHIFYSNSDQFYLIDLARVFKPIVFAQRFRTKDIAQVHYSAPKQYFSKTDRLRFYLNYTGHPKLKEKDKVFINKILNKATKMARHDAKHGRTAPFKD